jgi:hypothetical protein
MSSTATTWNDVVDALGRRSAVLASMPVTGENSPPIHCHPSVALHVDVVRETHHGRLWHGLALGAKDAPCGMDELGLRLENEQ